MRHYTYTKEMQDVQKLESIQCDWCRKSFKMEMDFDGTRNDTYKKDEFKLEWEWGDVYPEGGSGEKIEVEICSGCRKKLKKLLYDNGFDLRVEDWDC